MQSLFSENTTGQISGATNAQKAKEAVASYAITAIEGAVYDSSCAALKAESFDLPVCKIVKYIATYIASLYDLGNNAPSSQAGLI